MRIEEEFNKTGYFWLPGKEEKKIPGTLSIYDGGKIELEIVGHFGEEADSFNDDNEPIRIIGHIEKDGLVTLDGCIYIQKNHSFGGISKSEIRVHKVLSGAAWDKEEALTFNTFAFSVDCLDEWIGISGINIEHDWESRSTTISYSPPENISFRLANGMRFEICFAYTFPGSHKITEAKITQRAYFKLESEHPPNLNNFISIAFKITNLMCFAMDEVVSIQKVTATSTEIQYDAGDENYYPVPISIYYHSNPFPEKKPKKNRHEMLFNFRTIREDFQKVLDNWLNAYEYLYPAIGLYFSTKTGAQKYLEGKFLALAQGLETYHRRTSTETLMHTSSYEALIIKIMESCPKEHSEWLNGRLAHGNEINLGKRLKSIIDPFKAHLGTSKKRGKILRNIVDTRNYLTHYSEELKQKSAKGRDLWILCLSMEIIFNLHFLKVIGFTDNEIKEVIKSCHPLKSKLEEI
ncbi:hypothetical protein RCO22_12590 [Pseudomonas yamanorum]|uniref:ApeA N-terminal domain-containing protein n=1 Tax=Pseudomonas yamanorum TaxID=515393 RepID=A0ABU1CR95_9PSED|nr:HEPN domain-containing protein [Pseudomonas yamanorum]MDR0189779.1 hypothetical protein [Pseudomonas yamanorum]